MDPEWISLFASSGAALATTLAFPRVRSILRTILRRPRETSVIVEVGDRRVSLRGTATPEQIQRLVDEILREQGRTTKREDVDGSKAVTGGEADE